MTQRTGKPSLPFSDCYSIGFQLYRHGDMNWKHRTIAGVSWNGQEQEAFFFNAGGLSLPLKADPWRLPEWIREHAVRREFGFVHGYGYFSMKESRRNALSAAGRMNDWVTYWLVDQSGGFANESGVWQRYVEQDLETELAGCETLHSERRLQIEKATYVEQCLAERRAQLAELHRERSGEDRKLLAWLKGEIAAPLFSNEPDSA